MFTEELRFLWLATACSYDWWRPVLLTGNGLFLWPATACFCDWQRPVLVTGNCLFLWLAATACSCIWQRPVLVTANGRFLWLATTCSCDWRRPVLHVGGRTRLKTPNFKQCCLLCAYDVCMLPLYRDWKSKLGIGTSVPKNCHQTSTGKSRYVVIMMFLAIWNKQ